MTAIVPNIFEVIPLVGQAFLKGRPLHVPRICMYSTVFMIASYRKYLPVRTNLIFKITYTKKTTVVEMLH